MAPAAGASLDRDPNPADFLRRLLDGGVHGGFHGRHDFRPFPLQALRAGLDRVRAFRDDREDRVPVTAAAREDGDHIHPRHGHGEGLLVRAGGDHARRRHGVGFVAHSDGGDHAPRHLGTGGGCEALRKGLDALARIDDRHRSILPAARWPRRVEARKCTHYGSGVVCVPMDAI